MSETWNKMPALDGRANPCLCCPPIPAVLPMESVIAVGFGDAHVSRDGETIYHEPSAHEGMLECTQCDGSGGTERVICGACGGVGSVVDASAPTPEYWDVAEAEKVAALDPDHDWRIVKFGPLHGEEYQRQDGQWVLIAKSEGFA